MTALESWRDLLSRYDADENFEDYRTRTEFDRGSDRLSRILADEATVEALARLLAASNKEPGDPDETWLLWAEDARACLNHLAQLALGDGT